MIHCYEAIIPPQLLKGGLWAIPSIVENHYPSNKALEFIFAEDFEAFS